MPYPQELLFHLRFMSEKDASPIERSFDDLMELESKTCQASSSIAPNVPIPDLPESVESKEGASSGRPFPCHSSTPVSTDQCDAVPRGSGGPRSKIPILIELASTMFVQGLPVPTLTNGFFNMKGWLTSLVTDDMLPLWREAVHTLSNHSRREVSGWTEAAGNTCEMAPSVSAGLLSDDPTISRFCTSVTRKFLQQLGGHVKAGMVTANSWRQGQRNLPPVNLFKLTQFYVAWLLWDETGTDLAQNAADEAIVRIQESSSSTTDEAGSTIVQRLDEMMRASFQLRGKPRQYR